LRVLIAHVGLLIKRDDTAEIAEQIAGLVERSSDVLDVLATDGRTTYRPVLQGGQVEYVPLEPLRKTLAAGVDLAHIHMPVPISHLVLALRLRLGGARVLMSPMAMLGDDFSQKGWFKERTRLYDGLKPLFVRVLRLAWRAVTTRFACFSETEVRQARLPAEQTIVIPWTMPQTTLTAAAARQERLFSYDGHDAMPVAFVNRLDWSRKGFDRLCTWLAARADSLPRPAVLLFAPHEGEYPSVLDDLVEERLIDWHQPAYGSDLLAALEKTRGLMLLSRWDGQSRILREAALVGIPTISTTNSHFEPAIDVLGCGAIVDGDDVDSIQAAFTAVVGQEVDAGRAAALFDRGSVAAFLTEVYQNEVERQPIRTRNYYDWVIV
jgi:glycosyltransferase involved in cell wall biosynthesis